MKVLFILCATIAVSIAIDIEYYKTADDHLDIEALVKDRAKLQEYIDCFLDRKPCDPTPATYLKTIPEAIETGCKKCNPLQKHLAKVFLRGLQVSMPDEYDNFVKKFDPQGIYMDKFNMNIKMF